MRRVLKYSIQPDQLLMLSIPKEAEIIHFGHQREEPQIWIEVDPNMDGANPYPPTSRTFKLYATGEQIPDDWVHRGTVIVMGGRLVWHLYEEIQP